MQRGLERRQFIQGMIGAASAVANGIGWMAQRPKEGPGDRQLYREPTGEHIAWEDQRAGDRVIVVSFDEAGNLTEILTWQVADDGQPIFVEGPQYDCIGGGKVVRVHDRVRLTHGTRHLRAADADGVIFKAQQPA